MDEGPQTSGLLAENRCCGTREPTPVSSVFGFGLQVPFRARRLLVLNSMREDMLPKSMWGVIK